MGVFPIKSFVAVQYIFHVGLKKGHFFSLFETRLSLA